MYCNKCGNKLNGNENFCQKCGNCVQTINKQNIKNNTISRELQNPQNDVQNSNENQPINHNFKSMYEKILLVVNTVLWSFLIYYFYTGFCYVLLCFFLDLCGAIIIALLGGDAFELTENAIVELEKILPIFLILFVILVIFNGIMHYLMHKKNKDNTSVSTGVKVNKFMYLLAIYFLGTFGVHKFMIKDINGGIFRLVLMGVAVFVVVIGIIFYINLGYVHIALLGFAIGLQTTDFVVALAKTSDNEKKISY